MISKEKKQAIIAEYGRRPGDTGSDCNSDSKDSGVNGAFEEQSEGSSLKTRSFEDGWSETWST